MVTGAESGALLVALEGLDRQVAGLRLPVEAPDAERGRTLQREIADQLDDYVLPRLRRLDAPLLAVVGGPTGAGKSTLVNSLVGVRVSPAGVLRPTTRSAVLAHNPADGTWFDDNRILPGLRRVGATTDTDDPTALRLAPSDRIPAGLAVLDAPDIDSVVTSNRELATQLLAAADMWVFVTTAARYADAVPWEFLRAAVTRGTAVAVVLDRVPPDAVDEVRSHLASMLTEQGLGGAPLFVVSETATFDALLPDESVEPIRAWLHGLASDASLRAAVVRHTLDGAVRSLGARVFELAAAADAQAETVTRLGRAVDTAYDEAVADVDEASSDGSLLRGEVLARWQEFVGTGELMRSLEEKVGRVRDRVTAAVQGKPAPGTELAEALESGVEALVRSAADEAAEQVATVWAADPAGRVLLGDDPSLRRASADLRDRTERAVREWQGYVLELVRSQGQGKRRTARYLAFGVNGLGLMVMIVVFAHTGGLVAGEIAVAGGASALSQKILEAVMGDQAVRSLAESARADLHRRVEELLADERRRFADRLAGVAVDETAGAALRAAVQVVEEVR
ncbi:MAG TPA: ABC transporter [Actinomycetes bacterium]|nr:ABC transporter [Actinomycetes bacterium]